MFMITVIFVSSFDFYVLKWCRLLSWIKALLA